MKAAVIYRYGGPGEFRIEEMPRPEPDHNEVVIEVKAAGVNPVDWKQRNGNHRLFLKAEFPLVLGYDVAGKIVETGASVTRFKTGDRVYARCDRRFGGAYASYAATSESTLAFIPEKLDDIHAAAVPMAAVTALQALQEKAKLATGQHLLVIGAAGGVGHFALQIAKKLGARVTAVCHGRHSSMMNELAPDHWIDYTSNDILQSGDKYDIILDAASVYTYMACKHLLTKKGIYINLKPRPKMLAHKLISLFTSGGVKTLLMKSRGSDLEAISAMISEDSIRIFIDSVYPLEKIGDAHRRAQAYQTNGKIVVEIC